MATESTMQGKAIDHQPVRDDVASPAEVIGNMLRPIASLRLTVALFALGIFIILVGTLAQSREDMWEVMSLYFRSWVAWINVEVMFPYAWFPNLGEGVMRMVVGTACFLAGGAGAWLCLSAKKHRVMWHVLAWGSIAIGLASAVTCFAFGGFLCPGGATIGTLMALNLLSAHLLRFKVQAKGIRLAAGIAITLVGVAVTWLIIAGGHNVEGLQAVPIFEMTTLWLLCRVALTLVTIASVAFTIWVLKKMPHRLLELSILGCSSLILSTLTIWLWWAGDKAYLGDAGMRILWQLIQAEVAAIILLVGCVVVFKKRGGIVLIHGGVALLMCGEWFVSWYAVEERLIIQEGKEANYALDIRETELSVVDPNYSETHDDVVVVPRSLLVRNMDAEDAIRDDALPFDIKVLNYWKNSDVRRATDEDDNPATSGEGLNYIAEEARASSGADMSGEVDMASAYVQLLDKETGQPIDTLMLSQFMSSQDIYEPVSVDGKTYDLGLRFKRTYKPYTMYLSDVRKDDYLGTTTPRNYSSLVRLTDPSRNFERDDIKIWMNNPLRYAGETFYQSGYNVDPRTGTETTTLQVVTNTGWMIPYVACMLTATGMCAHFLIVLLRFLQRRANTPEMHEEVVVAELVMPVHKKPKKKRRGREPADDMEADTWPQIIVPLLIVIAFGGYALSKGGPAKTPADGFDYAEFAKLPVVYEGRVKPIDTLARNALKKISLRETFTDEEDGKGQPAVRWLLEVVANPEAAYERKLFRVESLDVLQTLGLERRSGFRYSLDEIRGDGRKPREELSRFDTEAKAAREKDAADLNTYERKLLETDNRFRAFTMLAAAFEPLDFPAFPTEEEFNADREGVTERIMRIRQLLAIAPESEQALTRMQVPLAVPDLTESTDSDDNDISWSPYATAANKAYLQSTVLKEDVNPATLSLAAIFDAYARDNPREFNREVAKYQKLLAGVSGSPVNTRKVAFESFMNQFAPFYYSAILCLVAFVLSAFAWLGWSRIFNRSAFWLLIFVFCLYTFGVVGRIYISGRPPVTNLYSSAIFIGLAFIIGGLCLELIFKLGIGNVVGGVGGFVALMIANNLSAKGDTFTVLQAVLDTQFWLSTHVVSVTFGYAVTFMAGILGILYVVLGVCTPTFARDPGFGKQLTRMIYGIICFAIFFSFVGTVLGGLWADDSWGRFWGWDPKENGALIIVLWNAIVLHARWGGMVKDRGIALLAIGGNIVTAWSWFGVNELGVGLHSYGFTEGVLLTLGLFVASQLAVIGVGLLPKRMWSSFSGNGDAVMAESVE